jgi:predicted enzyme related to lactoylglutathione lyase
MDAKPYEHGTFCWVELGTTDAQAAKKFYGGLLGWTFQDIPMAPGQVYTMCLRDGKRVGALYDLAGGIAPPGAPAHWASYISVESVDATATKAQDAGGSLIKEPFDVPGEGRMAVLKDPTGAMFCLWQSNTNPGVEIYRELGALCWNELFTTDPVKAGRFYAETIGWVLEPVDMGPMGLYTLFKRAGQQENKGGMMPIGPHQEGIPSHWLAYFAVASVDEATVQAKSLGARVQVEPTDIPNIGRFSVVADPQGAVLALYENAH